MEPRLSPGTFYGGTLRSYRTGEILLAESTYQPGCRIPTHTHDRAFGYLVLQGSCTETCSARTRVHLSSHLVLHPEGEAHSDHWADAPGRCLHIEFGPSWLQIVRQHSPILDHSTACRGGSPVWLAARLYQEIRAPDGVSPLIVDGLALELVAQAAREAPGAEVRHPPPWLRRVEERLRSQFRAPPTIAELALGAGVHPVHLATSFRRRLRCTPGEYVRRLRVEFACRRLVTRTPLAEIALDAGFADQSHFCRVFKAVTGLTPTAYRRAFSPAP
jgi:AraC family transcriptional regulator